MKKTVAFIIAALFATAALAYPIRPRPLRELVIESQYIIHGIVLETGQIPASQRDPSYWCSDFARILVKEVLQGGMISDTITVYYTARLICPAPAVYTKGAEMIAFLNKTKTGTGYETHALSYGVKYEGLPLYKSRIAEIQQILKINDKQEQQARVTDWLVECALAPATRWEGVYELVPMGHLFDGKGRNCKSTFLSIAQQNQLFTALMATDTLDYYSDQLLVQLVKGINDEALLTFLKSRLPRFPDQYLWQANGIMYEIIDLTGSTELKNLQMAFSKEVFSFAPGNKSKAILADFISKLQTTGLKKIVAAPTDITAL